jgi:phosphoribosylanthranilate isomerase
VTRVRVKICGVTTPADAAFAIDAGADAIGLNFYPKSPRFVTAERAAELVAGLPPLAAVVGVFVDATQPDIRDRADARGLTAYAMATDQIARQLVERFGLAGVQTYSDRPPAVSFRPAAHIPAFRVKDDADLEPVRRYVAACSPAAVLLDSFVAGEVGGTGHVAPWHLLAGFDPGVPVLLAGGLTPENVAEAVRVVRPWGVDVASGVESAPGVKDPAKVAAFVRAVRATSP